MSSHQHGVARTAPLRTAEQRQQDADKIQRYRSLEDQVRAKVADCQYDADAFELTARLLRQNPEYYTAWNVRRRCLTSGLFSRPSAGSSPSTALPSSSASATPIPSSAASSSSSSTATPQARDSPTTGTSGTTPDVSASAADSRLVQSELAFTIPLLVKFPKCYWIWNYRSWMLQQAIQRLPPHLARAIWDEELRLVTKMLAKDQRNFHAWGYRRGVVARLESPALNGASMVESEFVYTTDKIHTNLSNFSAWHSRSQLIPRLLDERGADEASRNKFLEQEFKMVGDALNVGPEDQSLWFYHQYLIANLVGDPGSPSFVPHLSTEERESYIRREVVDIKDLLEDYSDIKWIYEALIEHNLALYRLKGQKPQGKDRSDVAQWLNRLNELDPMRKGRWKDLEEKLGFVQ